MSTYICTYISQLQKHMLVFLYPDLSNFDSSLHKSTIYFFCDIYNPANI